MLSKKNLMVTMVTDEFLENRIILQKSVATIGFIWFFWFQKCILLYIFVQIFLEMRCIRSHISFFRLGLTPTLKAHNWQEKNIIQKLISGKLNTGLPQNVKEKWLGLSFKKCCWQSIYFQSIWNLILLTSSAQLKVRLANPWEDISCM